MQRPRVVLNIAATVDGKIASSAREPGRLTGDTDLSFLHELRARADAIVVGAGTLRAIDPPLRPRDSSARPLHVVISGNGRVDPRARALADPSARRILATTKAAEVPELPGVEIWRFGERVEASELLRRLGELGVTCVLVEGGGETNATFVEAGLVDEVYLTVAPALLGGRGAPTPVDGAGLGMDERVRLRLDSVREVDGELFCHYLVEK